MQHKPLKQKQQKPKKVAHKHTKKAPHKIAKRGMKFSTLGLTRGNPVADFEQQVLPETPELETIGANTRPDGKGADVTSLFRTFDHADEQLHKVLHLTPEEFKKKFPTEESLAAWEDAVDKLDGVSQVVPTSVLMENKIQEFNESETVCLPPLLLLVFFTTCHIFRLSFTTCHIFHTHACTHLPQPPHSITISPLRNTFILLLHSRTTLAQLLSNTTSSMKTHNSQSPSV